MEKTIYRMFWVSPNSGVDRGVGNGAFAPPGPPSQNCYALDSLEFFHFLYKILILIAIFSQKCPTAPRRLRH